MRITKRKNLLYVLLLTLIVAFSLMGCGKNDKKDSKNDDKFEGTYRGGMDLKDMYKNFFDVFNVDVDSEAFDKSDWNLFLSITFKDDKTCEFKLELDEFNKSLDEFLKKNVDEDEYEKYKKYFSLAMQSDDSMLNANWEMKDGVITLSRDTDKESFELKYENKEVIYHMDKDSSYTGEETDLVLKKVK